MDEILIKSWIRDLIELAKPKENVYLHSPNGTKWEITVDDLGVITATDIS